MRLNIGAGSRRLDGYTGVDITPRPAADIVAPAHEIPLADGSVEEIIAIHLLEHLYPWDAPVALKEWHRLLKPGGLLVLELSNLRKCCQNIVDGRADQGKDPRQLGMWGIYGDDRYEDPFMLHRWGFTPESLIQLLKGAGFVGAVETPTRFHPVGRIARDMRIEARKG